MYYLKISNRSPFLRLPALIRTPDMQPWAALAESWSWFIKQPLTTSDLEDDDDGDDGDGGDDGDADDGDDGDDDEGGGGSSSRTLEKIMTSKTFLKMKQFQCKQYCGVGT